MPDPDLREMAEAELAEAHGEAKRELFNLRFQLATGQLENTARIQQVKRRVARIRTELRARESAAAGAAGQEVEA